MIIGVCLVTVGCSPRPQNIPTTPGEESSSSSRSSSFSSTASLKVSPLSAEDFTLETIAEGLEVPWSIAFASENRILVTERPGRLRLIENGILKLDPLLTFPEVSSQGEEGLMGITLDPDYEDNHSFYVCLAYTTNQGMVLKVQRLTDEGNRAVVNRTIIDAIPAARFHAGCAVAFGPDGKLYITAGDATERALAQDLSSLAGKIFRINADGSIPEDNPFPDSPIWSYGHRNPQGIAWHPETGEMYATEHGPSGFDGPGGGDEVNRIIRGGNYGWPIVSHERSAAGLIDPLKVYTPAEAPASAAFYNGEFFFGALRGEALWRIVFSEDDPDAILLAEEVPLPSLGRIRNVLAGQDGALYFTTSNRDGRGSARKGDDKLLRLVPRK